MDIDFAKKLFSVPTCSKHEDLMVDFLESYAIDNNIPYKIDDFGNIYLIKGEITEDDRVPCVVSHIDTVHHSYDSLIKNNDSLIIKESILHDKRLLKAYHPNTNELLPIGGDDKAGVAICLELILKFDKIIAAFFREEEIGCHGSANSDEEIFKNVGYAIQFDAPGNNWVSKTCNGVQLFNEEFFNEIKDILKDFGQTKISNDPYTDVYKLKELYDFNCINFFAGYYNMHRDDEYVVVEDMEKAVLMGEEIIKKLGNKKYEFIHKPFDWTKRWRQED
jgi:di/tripeptidase